MDWIGLGWIGLDWIELNEKILVVGFAAMIDGCKGYERIPIHSVLVFGSFL